MYVDETGDTGMNNSASSYYGLLGIVLSELRWQSAVDHIVDFRKQIKAIHGLPQRDEIHSYHFLFKPGKNQNIEKYKRLEILRKYLDHVAHFPDWGLISVIVDKSGKDATFDPFTIAWTALIQRFENTMRCRNFPGPSAADERGMIIADNGEEKKLRALLRKMRVYNPIPHTEEYKNRTGQPYRNNALSLVIEDPTFRDSAHSLLIQTADVCAYFLHQKFKPNSYLKKKGGHNYFDRLDPVLVKKISKTSDGIVHL